MCTEYIRVSSRHWLIGLVISAKEYLLLCILHKNPASAVHLPLKHFRCLWSVTLKHAYCMSESRSSYNDRPHILTSLHVPGSFDDESQMYII